MYNRKYVAGFLFDPTCENIVLIRKNKPKWQEGLLNGVGGKILPKENPYDAMRREFEEEAGVIVENWRAFAKLHRPHDFILYFFVSFAEYPEQFWAVETQEDELIEIHKISNLDYSETIDNLPWLIPLALDQATKYTEVEYWQI